MAHGPVARQPPRRRRGAGFFHMVVPRPDIGQPPVFVVTAWACAPPALLEIEDRLSGGFDDHALAGDDLVSSRSNLFRQIQWYNHGAVAVGIN